MRNFRTNATNRAAASSLLDRQLVETDITCRMTRTCPRQAAAVSALTMTAATKRPVFSRLHLRVIKRDVSLAMTNRCTE